MKNINFEELRSNEFSFPLAKETIDVSDINTLIEWLLTGPRLKIGRSHV